MSSVRIVSLVSAVVMLAAVGCMEEKALTSDDHEILGLDDLAVVTQAVTGSKGEITLSVLSYEPGALTVQVGNIEPVEWVRVGFSATLNEGAPVCIYGVCLDIAWPPATIAYHYPATDGVITLDIAGEGFVQAWAYDYLDDQGVYDPQTFYVSEAVAAGEPAPEEFDVTHVATSAYTSCALVEDGVGEQHVECWGYDYFGSISGAPQGQTDFASLEGGGRGTFCAQHRGATVTCWGDKVTQDGVPATIDRVYYTDIGNYGAVCAGNVDTRTIDCYRGATPTQPFAGMGEFLYPETNYGNYCALRWDGSGTECVGIDPAVPEEWHSLDGVAALSDGICGINTDRTISCVTEIGYSTPSEYVSEAPTHPSGFKALEATRLNLCGLSWSGAVNCTGYAGYGVNNAPSGNVRQFDLQNIHGCGVTYADKVICWGGDNVSTGWPPAEVPPHLRQY